MKNSKPVARVIKIKFESRGDLLNYLHSHGVRWNELAKLNTK